MAFRRQTRDEVAEPTRYLALATSEHALAALAAASREGRSTVLLAGPAGIGKTAILFELAAREQRAGRRVRLSRSFRIPPDHVAGWLLHRLFGRDADSEADAERALLEALRSAHGERAVLLVDDVHLALPDSLARAAELAREVAPALVLIAAGTTGDALDARLACLEPRVRVALPDRLPDDEIEELCDSLSGSAARTGTGAAIARARASAAHARAALVSGGSRLRTLLRAAGTRLARLASGVRARAPLAAARALESASRCLAGARGWLESASRARVAVARLALGYRSRALWERARRLGPATAAVVVVASALAALLLRDGSVARAPPVVRPAPTAPPPVSATPTRDPDASRPAPQAAPAALPVDVQVNARPWANIRIDGVEMGATPLTHRLAPGPHEIEGEFPDGRVVRRRIVVTSEQRFISLP